MSNRLTWILEEIISRCEGGELPPLGSSVFTFSPDADEMTANINEGMHAPIPEEQLGESFARCQIEGNGEYVVRCLPLPLGVYVATWGGVNG